MIVYYRINKLVQAKPIESIIEIKGWVRSFRSNRFIMINDGSCIENLQVVVEHTETNDFNIKDITVGSCLRVTGKLIESPGLKQDIELQAHSITIYGGCNPDSYPIQPKKHTMEFLRHNPHLRMRTNTFGSIYRIKHNLAFAIHEFFHKRDFMYLHTPIITPSDSEGAGQMFTVTNLLDADNCNVIPDFKEDFFGRHTKLTVSGQLEAEVGALALGLVYTFGPTFRAENSNTTRHLSEFWMVEPEMAFYNLEDTTKLAQEFIQYTIKQVLNNCEKDILYLNDRFVKEEMKKPKHYRLGMSLIERLKFVAENDFARITYTEAIDILKSSKTYKKGKFSFPLQWGVDLQAEHERYLVEKHFKSPVIVINYPKSIKAFYMKQNKDTDSDRPTVKAMDILFPYIGEVIGGSQREDNEEIIRGRMKEMKIDIIEWYLRS